VPCLRRILRTVCWVPEFKATSAAPPAVVSVTTTAAAAPSAVVAPSSSAISSAVVQASTVPDPHPASGPDAAGSSSSPDDAAGPSSFSGPSASAPTSASRKRALPAVAAAAADRPRSAAEDTFRSLSMWRITLAPDNSSVGDDEVPAAAAKAEIDEFTKEEKLFRADEEIDSFDPLLWWKDSQLIKVPDLISSCPPHSLHPSNQRTIRAYL
jgi:hypothetical protein